jgi:hypothetical protein
MLAAAHGNGSNVDLRNSPYRHAHDGSHRLWPNRRSPGAAVPDLIVGREVAARWRQAVLNQGGFTELADNDDSVKVRATTRWPNARCPTSLRQDCGVRSAPRPTYASERSRRPVAP